jgi:micrococcal nuclease
VLVLAATACAPAASTGGGPAADAPAAAVASTSQGGPTRPDDAEGPYPVVDVVDGDTIKVEIDGEKVTVRVVGIDTPETKDPRRPVQCFGREASAQAEALLDGQDVWLATDPTQDRYDRYDRLLAHVWLPDGRLFEWVMVHDGYAHEYTYALPYQHQADLQEAERDARDAGRGLWAPASCAGDTTRAAE